MTSDLPPYVLDASPLAMFTRLQRVGLHLERLQSEAMLEIDMTFGDYTLLATLRREPAPHALPVGRLADLVLRPMGSITQVIDRLANADLVRREYDRADRRRVLIELTAAGGDIADRGDAAYRRGRERVLAELDGPDRAAIDTAVLRLLEALEEDRRPNS